MEYAYVRTCHSHMKISDEIFETGIWRGISDTRTFGITIEGGYVLPMSEGGEQFERRPSDKLG